MIDELLLLAEVENADVQLVPLDMAAIVAASLHGLEQQIAALGGRVVSPSEWPSPLGHPPWVELIWTNYITNALKYGGRPPRVELGASEEGGTATFWVQDNGRGIASAERSELFKPFTRLAGTQAKGHGLGLSIVLRLAEKMGGRVGVESGGVDGGGCRFLFSLSLAGARQG